MIGPGAHPPSIPVRWESQVHARPHAVALCWQSESRSFDELDRQARQVVGWLSEQGVEPGDIVANRLPRSAEAIVVQLAVLLAGATHLTLDPQGPQERTEAILRDARPAVVVEPAAWRQAMNRDPVHVRRWAGGAETTAAYVVYTSGSSGEPKGVVVEHRSLANLLFELEQQLMPLGTAAAGRARLRVAHGISLSFDASWDPLLWLVAGHELHVLSDRVRTDAALLDRTIAEESLDVVEVTPGLVEQLVRRGLLHAPHAPALLLTGGEAVGQGLWSELHTAPRTIAVNLYGPSECTVFATWARADRFATPVIGHPIAGTHCRIVDRAGSPVPDGRPGELVVTGLCVARGYLGRPALTAGRFSVTAGRDGPVRSYRTGDLARRRADGALEFLGRTDGQVKLRGHRIELGEVETALLAHPAVGQAAVRLRDLDGTADLVAFVVPSGGVEIDREDLRTFAARRLPPVMIPAAFAVLDELPVTPYGKIDRSALEPPPRSASGGPSDAPRGELECVMAAEFAAVLKLGRIGRDDSFFELGGHSLLAAVVSENLRRAAIPCSLTDVMENPRISQLAEVIGSRMPPTTVEGSL